MFRCPRAAGDTHLGDDDAVLSNDHVVRDLDKAVDFRSFANPCSAKARAVNRGAGTDLHVIVYLHDADLIHLDMFTAAELVAESVAADNAATVNDDAIAYRAALFDHGVGMNDTVLSEFGTVTDERARMDRATLADQDIVFDDGIRPDINFQPVQRSGVANDRRGMNPRSKRLLLRAEAVDNFLKRQRRILNYNQRHVCRCIHEIGRYQHDAGIRFV